MASRKGHRTDGRVPLLPCGSSLTISMFVGICLLGVWILTSSSISPFDLYDLKPTSANKESENGEKIERDRSDRTDFHSPQSQHATENTSDPNVHDSSEEEIDEDKIGNTSDTNVQDPSEKEIIEEKFGKNTVTSNGEEAKSLESEDEDEKDQTVARAGDRSIDKRHTSFEVTIDHTQSKFNNETGTHGGHWSTNGTESGGEEGWKSSYSQTMAYEWKLCNITVGPDYIPCLDNVDAILKLPSTKHYEHRERHCPKENPTCVVPLPKGYKRPLKWPQSREKIWYANAPHTKLVATKGHQNWVKEDGKYLTFPGGGTQFKHGALNYIDFIQKSMPDIAWGKKSRVVLDVGCGVASFGGFLFERNVITMSFAPKDEHEAQVQFALERGIPAVLAVMGTKRLPFPSMAFDVVHCARCRVPWHIEGGVLLLELNRLLRPGGYFVWSATPVYEKTPEDIGIWKAMSKLTKAMCWDLMTRKRSPLDKIGLVIFRKPSSNDCYRKRIEKSPPLCSESSDPDATWNVHLEACLHRLPMNPSLHGSRWPEQWPSRLKIPPHWLNRSLPGLYGEVAPLDFKMDHEHWKHVVNKFYLSGVGIEWSTVRNVMDMRSVYGGFAAALKDMNVWVMNVVPIDSPDTLPVIYDRGLLGIYHDWCESFSTYPRTYDLLHADHLFSWIGTRCSLLSVIAEVDRILRPEGKVIIRDNTEMIDELVNLASSLKWKIHFRLTQEKEGLLCLQKSWWRPQKFESGAPSTT